MEKLTDKNKEYLMANSPATLPLDAFNGGWSEQRIRDKFSVGFTIIFAWLKGIQEDGLTSDDALDKAIKDNKEEYDAFKKVANEKFDALTEEDKALKKLIDDLEEKHDDEKRELDSKIDMVKETLENADDILEGKKLDKSNGTATNLRIHQMADGDEGATNKAYVDKLVSDAIKDATKEHIKDFKVNTKANGVYEFVLTLDNGVQFKQEIDTPDERILNPNRPPYIDDNAHLILTFVDNTSVSVDLSKLVDTYKGSSNDYAVVEVSADNTIVVTLEESWRTLLDNARADYATWTGNENRRLATELRLGTLETNLNNKLIQYEDINKTALDLISKANTILINAGIAEEESY